MDEDIVHEKIGEAVDGDTESDVKTKIHFVHHAEINQDHTRYSEDQKEGIVLFEEAGFGLMMILVEIPAESMHHVFMGKPGHEFHDAEGGQYDGDIDQLW